MSIFFIPLPFILLFFSSLSCFRSLFLDRYWILLEESIDSTCSNISVLNDRLPLESSNDLKVCRSLSYDPAARNFL